MTDYSLNNVNWFLRDFKLRLNCELVVNARFICQFDCELKVTQ